MHARFDFKGRRAIVCGGSRGIGLAIAKAFAGAGASVSICARGEASLAEARAALEALGGNVHAARCDLGDGAAVTRYVQEAAAALGGIDALVNNASAFGHRDTDADWASSVAVDLMAPVRASHAAMPFLEHSKGAIVHISSIAGLRPSTRTPPYGAVKAALVQYTQTQAAALAKKGIRVNCIAPGSIYFEGGVWDVRKREEPKLYEGTLARIPSGRFGRPEEIASVTLFLASDASSWMTGQTLTVDGGQTLT